MGKHRPLIKTRFNDTIIEKGGQYIIKLRKDGRIKERYDRKTSKKVKLK